MEIKEYKTGQMIEVKTPGELKEVLKYCNPTMMKYYRNQLPQLSIKGFGTDITIKRKQV